MVSNEIENIKEKLAAIEHERWAGWQKWMHGVCEHTPTGDLFIPAELVDRWNRQIATPYEELSDIEKQSDREQVDRYWPLIAALLARDDARIARLEKVCEAARYMLAVGPYAKARDQLTVALAALDADAPGRG